MSVVNKFDTSNKLISRAYMLLLFTLLKTKLLKEILFVVNLILIVVVVVVN